jgi:hypothetical protein
MNLLDGGLAPKLCDAGTTFCEGNTLWECTHSGYDAVGANDCASSGTMTNPGICATTQCPPNSKGACCRPTTAPCTWAMTEPALSGDTFNPGGTAVCQPPTCAQDTFVLELDTNLYHQACPPPPNESIVLMLKRPFAVGMPIDLSMASPNNVTLQVTKEGGPVFISCSQWTGTVTVNTDLPMWKVTFDATCGDGAGLKVTGAISGSS